MSTGSIPTLHQRMQKIGEHLHSGDDTSICAAPVTGALQFSLCGGVRSVGRLPSSLAEGRSTGTRPWNWRPGLACQPKSLSPSPSPNLAPQVLITVPVFSLRWREQSLVLKPHDPYFSIQSSASSEGSNIIPAETFPPSAPNPHQPGSLVPDLASAASISSPS